MKMILHMSADASHYDTAAKDYDAYNEENSKQTNKQVESRLKKHRVMSVLDLTCGTGSQVLWLAKRGYDVVGVDVNEKMLNMARKKAKKEGLAIPFTKGDMRTSSVGSFDAVITIFNAVGHLTKSDFKKSIRNIHKNLKPGGLYIFDIFNLNYLLHKDNITKLTIDWQCMKKDIKIRTIQYSTIDKRGVLTSYTTSSVQKNMNQPKLLASEQTLQVYNAEQLKTMLEGCGFEHVERSSLDGQRFSETKTERLLILARKPKAT